MHDVSVWMNKSSKLKFCLQFGVHVLASVFLGGFNVHTLAYALNPDLQNVRRIRASIIIAGEFSD